jgi:hypothetical protein
VACGVRNADDSVAVPVGVTSSVNRPAGEPVWVTTSTRNGPGTEDTRRNTTGVIPTSMNSERNLLTNGKRRPTARPAVTIAVMLGSRRARNRHRRRGPSVPSTSYPRPSHGGFADAAIPGSPAMWSLWMPEMRLFIE